MKTAEEAVAEVLEHHGVKGMKWGVRKARQGGAAAAGGAKVAGKTVAKGAGKVNTARKDAKFRRQRNSGRTIIMLVNAAAVNTKKDDLPRINAKYKGTAKTSNEVSLFNTSRIPAQKAYRKEVAQAYRKNLEKAANATLNASGTRRYEIRDKIGAKKGAPVRWKVRTRKIEHADVNTSGIEEFEVELVMDENGFITDFKPVEDSMAQGEEFMEDFLAHHGVKGMKWGVRREKHQGAATVTSRTNAGVTGRTRVKATRGGGEHAHEDAVKVAGKKAVLKRSGTAALSNKDLQDIIERGRLETQAREATASTGKKFIKKKLGSQVDQGINQEIQRSIRKKREGK